MNFLRRWIDERRVVPAALLEQSAKELKACRHELQSALDALQDEHLASGKCDCHDSWDQCPCSEGGHPRDGSCDCCPLGTGLCGPKPGVTADPSP